MAMDARLEVDVKSAASGPFTCGGECLFCGMWLTLSTVVSLARKEARAIQNDRADHGIWTRPEVRKTRQLQGARRPMQVNARCVVQGM
jgi:hypothetical protein